MCPKFQVTGPVIVTDAVSMMNLFAAPEWSTEHSCHDLDMLGDVAVLMCVRVVGFTNVDVAVIGDDPTMHLAKWR